MLKTLKLPWQLLLFSIFKVSCQTLSGRRISEDFTKEIEYNWNQSQTDVKKWHCLRSLNLRLKIFDFRGDCCTANIGPFLCFSRFNSENTKKNTNIHFWFMALACASWSRMTLLSHLKRFVKIFENYELLCIFFNYANYTLRAKLCNFASLHNSRSPGLIVYLCAVTTRTRTLGPQNTQRDVPDLVTCVRISDNWM